MANIGFIGLGNMGGPMASNLLKAGHSVRAFDLVDSALQAIANEGGEACDSAVTAIDGVDVVISMLPASVHVENHCCRHTGYRLQYHRTSLIAQSVGGGCSKQHSDD